MGNDIPVSKIAEGISLGFNLLFVFIIVIFLLCLLRGFFRSWKQGTFRISFFFVLFLVALLTLAPLTEAIGGIDIRGIAPPVIRISVEHAFTLEAETSTLLGTIKDLVLSAILTSDAGIDPASVIAVADSLAHSALAVILLFVEALLIVTIGNLLALILWHALFKRIFTTKEERADKKRKHAKRWISLIEEGVIAIVCMFFIMAPLTSLTNAVTHSWNSTSQIVDENNLRRVDNKTVQDIDTIVSAYEDSLFAKVFFSWNQNGKHESVDQQIINLLTSFDGNNQKVGVISTLGDVGTLGSLALQSGLVGDENFTSEQMTAFLTSKFVPLLINTLADTSIFTDILPAAFSFATSLDQIKEIMGVDEGLDFSSVNGASLHRLSEIYEDILNSGALSDITNPDGSLKPTGDIAYGLFSESSSQAIHEALAKLDDEDLSFLNLVFRAFLTCQGGKVLKAQEEAIARGETPKNEITILDFLPDFPLNWDADHNGVPDRIPEGFENIKLGNEICAFFDSLVQFASVDPALVKTFTNALNDAGEDPEKGENGTSIDMNAFFEALMNNVKDVGPVFTGVSKDGIATGKNYLLNSFLIQTGLPNVISFVGESFSESFDFDDPIDLDYVIASLKDDDPEVQKLNLVVEFRGIFNVLESLLGDKSTDYAGKKFVMNLETKYGLYNDPSGSLLGIDENLLTCLANAMDEIDQSMVFEEILGKVVGGFLKDLPIFGEGMKFDSDCENLGGEIASMLRAYKDNQPVVSFLQSLGNGLNDPSGNLLKPLTDANSHYADMLIAFLKAFNSNKYFNPTWTEGGVTTNNLYSIVSSLFEGMLGSSYDASLVRAAVTGADDVELKNFVDALVTIASSNILNIFTSGSIELSSLTKLSFEEILKGIGDSNILRALFVPLLNDKVLSNEMFTAKDKNGNTISVSFDINADLEAEGRILDAIISFASNVGDLSNIDFLNSDPEAIGEIIRLLASSTMFEEDNVSHFPEFIADKLVSSFMNAGKAGSFFVNRDHSLFEKTTFTKNDFSEIRAKIESIGKGSVSLSTVMWEQEAIAITELLQAVVNLGGFEALSNLNDFSALSSDLIADVIYAAENSKAFGAILLYHVHEKVNDVLGQSLNNFANSKVLDAVKTDNMEIIHKEDVLLLNLLSLISNPTGLDGSGNAKYPLLNPSTGEINPSISLFGPNALTGKQVVSFLGSFASSRIYNTLPSSSETMTPFEKQLSSILFDSGIYGPKSKTEVDNIIKGVAPDNVNFTFEQEEERLTVWNEEIVLLGQLVDEANALGIDFSEGIDVKSLLEDSSKREENKLAFEKVLFDLNESAILYKALPIQIETALENAELKFNGSNINFSNAKFDYMNGARYERGEVKNLVNIFYLYSLLGYDVDATILNNASTAPIAKELLAYLKFDRILSTPKNAAQPSVVSSFASFFEVTIPEPSPSDPNYAILKALRDAQVKLNNIWNSLEKPDYLG